MKSTAPQTFLALIAEGKTPEQAAIYLQAPPIEEASEAEARQLVADYLAKLAQQSAVKANDGHVDSTRVFAAQATPTFKNLAEPLIQRGIPVIPLLPRTKKAFSNDWPNLATTDPAQIAQWDAQYPDANIGCVALAKPDGVWFFEIDDSNLYQRIKQETGQKFPTTFRVRSSAGKGHIYFRHTASTLELANKKAYYSLKKADGGEACSARLNHAYVAGPGSLHPDTGLPYEILSNADVIPAPEWLVDWIKKNLANNENKLPVTASSDGPRVARGSHDIELTRIAGALRAKGLTEEEMLPVLIRNIEERFDDYGPDYIQMAEKVAHSIGKKPAGISSIPVLHGGVPVEQCQPDIAGMPSAQATGRNANGNALPVIDDQPPIADEPYPEFPEMSGALWNLAKEMFPDIPLSLKFMALVTHWGLVRSGLDILAGQRNFQTRFYTCLVTEPWRGKTAAMNEAHNYLQSIYPSAFLYADSVDSAPALVDDFEDLRKAHPAAEHLRILLHADEMADLFEKAKTTAQSRNTLGTTWLNLFESNRASNRARQANKGKRIEIENAHLAILGGTTPQGYEQMWQKTCGGSNGLMSRFIPVSTNAGMIAVTPCESTTEATKCLQQIIDLARKPKQTVYIDGTAERVLADWWMPYRTGAAKVQSTSVIRVLDIVKRMILILAVTNPSENDLLGDENCIRVEPALVQQACAFGDYVIKMRDRLNPADSYSAVQHFENAILATFDKYPDRALTEPFIRAQLSIHQKPGGIGAYLKAWQNVMRTDVQQVAVSRKGSPVYRKIDVSAAA